MCNRDRIASIENEAGTTDTLTEWTGTALYVRRLVCDISYTGSILRFCLHSLFSGQRWKVQAQGASSSAPSAGVLIWKRRFCEKAAPGWATCPQVRFLPVPKPSRRGTPKNLFLSNYYYSLTSPVHCPKTVILTMRFLWDPVHPSSITSSPIRWSSAGICSTGVSNSSRTRINPLFTCRE